jgi:hypothetical protein
MLMKGKFVQGMPLYEKRLEKKEFSCLKETRSLKARQEVQGKTILVRCEQGLGDTPPFGPVPAAFERQGRPCGL